MISIETRNERYCNAKPATFLGKGEFPKYLAACREVGAKFDKEEKCQIVALSALPRFTQALQEQGFEYRFGEGIESALNDEANTVDHEREESRVRVERIDAWLQENHNASLFQHQKEGIDWLHRRTHALLHDDMGLGKTLQALMSIPRGTGTVVVCPANVKGVWERETNKWRPDLTPVSLKGRKSFRWPERDEVIIINYDILPESIGDPSVIVNLVADEAHKLKTFKAQRTQRFRRIGSKSARVWLLTGTPMMNKPQELWSVLQAASLGAPAYGNWDGFCKVFNGRRGRYGYEWGIPTEDASRRLRAVALGRRKGDVLDLPERRHEFIDVDISKATKECDKLLDLLTFDPEEVDLETLLSDKVVFENISRVRAVVAAAKVKALMEQVELHEEAEEPLIVFSAHRAPIDAIEGREGWAVITGDTPARKRTQIEDDFQAGKLRGVAGTIAAMGTGMTFTRASRVVFVDRSWTPADNQQAEDRVHRIGQGRTCEYLHLVGDHAIDQMVTRLLATKKVIIGESVEKATGGPSESSTDVLRALVS